MDTVLRFITVLLVFVFVLVITYFTTRFIGNYQKNTMSGGTIKLLEGIRLNNSTYIQIVRVAGRIIVLAVSKDNVSSIAELTLEEYEKALEENSDNANNNDAFQTLLDKAKSALPNKKN